MIASETVSHIVHECPDKTVAGSYEITVLSAVLVIVTDAFFCIYNVSS